MRSNNIETGRRGEEIAREYLRKRGYRIVEQNYRTRYAELDLIVRGCEGLVFVEVRTKAGERYGSPEESLNTKKIRRLIRAAAAYTVFNRYEGGWRIDAVCIVLDRNMSPQRISHYRCITLKEEYI